MSSRFETASESPDEGDWITERFLRRFGHTVSVGAVIYVTLGKEKQVGS